jgi:hypothetical protein
MTYQPGEQPYTQPQDPWSGTQGIAAAPTDPIPQPPARGQFTPGVASPSVWVQETVAHSDPYAAQARGGGRAGLYILVVLLVVVLGGAGGFGAWWAITNYAGGTGVETPPSNTTTTTTTTGPTSPTPDPTETLYRGEVVPEGTCMINRGSAVDAEMFLVPCDWEGDLEVLEVLRTFSGEDIPEDPAGDFTLEVTAQPLCGDLPRFNRYFGWNSSNDAQDSFYCMSTDVDAG